MATGAVPTTFTSVKSKGHGLGFTRNVEFVKVSEMDRVKFRRTKVSLIRNSSSGSEIVELQPASEGSPLLGISLFPFQPTCDCLFKFSCYFSCSNFDPFGI